MDNKKQPLVSVIMPVYNAQSFLKQAIDSVMDQTYQKFELILVDDASSDNSPKIMQEYKKKFPGKIKIVTLSTNLNGGGDRCANEGLKKARGTYIARMDADDIAHRTRFEKQVEFLETNKDVFLVGSNAYVINKKGKIIGEKKEPTTPSDIYDSYFTFHPLIHPTCMLRKKFNGKRFFYKLNYNSNNDYYTFFSLLCRGAIFVNLPEKLVYYRIHGKNDTFVHIKKKYINTLKIRIAMFVKFGYQPSIKSILINLVQGVICLVLPERILFEMYMASKGITNKKTMLSNIREGLKIGAFVLPKKASV